VTRNNEGAGGPKPLQMRYSHDACARAAAVLPASAASGSPCARPLDLCTLMHASKHQADVWPIPPSAARALGQTWWMVVDCVDDLLIALRGDATAHPQEIIDCDLAGIGEVGKPFFQEVVFCSCPRSASCRTAVATNVLVTLAIRNGCSKRRGARVRRSATDDESISTSIRNCSSKSRLEAENAALRHQLIVLQRRGLLAKTLRSIAPSST
jgi:hypothetical protein